MIRVKGTVNINASPEQVFVLLSDARQCAELNPRSNYSRSMVLKNSFCPI